MKTRLDEINHIRRLMGLPLIKENKEIINEQLGIFLTYGAIKLFRKTAYSQSNQLIRKIKSNLKDQNLLKNSNFTKGNLKKFILCVSTISDDEDKTTERGRKNLKQLTKKQSDSVVENFESNLSQKIYDCLVDMGYRKSVSESFLYEQTEPKEEIRTDYDKVWDYKKITDDFGIRYLQKKKESSDDAWIEVFPKMKDAYSVVAKIFGDTVDINKSKKEYAEREKSNTEQEKQNIKTTKKQEKVSSKIEKSLDKAAKKQGVQQGVQQGSTKSKRVKPSNEDVEEIKQAIIDTIKGFNK